MRKNAGSITYQAIALYVVQNECRNTSAIQEEQAKVLEGSSRQSNAENAPSIPEVLQPGGILQDNA